MEFNLLSSFYTFDISPIGYRVSKELFSICRLPHCPMDHMIYNSKKLETTQMSPNQGMDTVNVVHLQYGILLSY